MASNTSIKSILSALNGIIANTGSISNAANKFIQSNKDAQNSTQFSDLLKGLVSQSTVKKENTIKLSNNAADNNKNFKSAKNTVQDKNDRNVTNTSVQKRNDSDKSEETISVKDKSALAPSSKPDDVKPVSASKVDDAGKTKSVSIEPNNETVQLTPEAIAALLGQLQQLLENQFATVENSTVVPEADVAVEVTNSEIEVVAENITQLSQKVLDLLEKLNTNSPDLQKTLLEGAEKQDDINIDIQKQITVLLDKIKDVVSPEDLEKPIKIQVEQVNSNGGDELLNKIKLTLDSLDNSDENEKIAELKPMVNGPNQSLLGQQTINKNVNTSNNQDQFQQETTKNDTSDNEQSEDLFSESLSAAALDGGKFEINSVLPGNNGIQNLETVRNTIVNGVKSNHQQINLQLEPANLGQLRVQISRQIQQGEAVVSARLITNNLDAKDAIQNQIHSLTQSLESQGIKVGKIEVIDSGKHQETVLNQMQQLFSNDSKVSESNNAQDTSNQNPQNKQQGQDGFTQNFSQYQQAFQEQQQQSQVLREYEKLYASSTLNMPESIEPSSLATSEEELRLQNASISLNV